MIATVTSMRLSKDAWTDVVNTMVSRGLQVSSTDKTAIINYLAANLAPAPNGSAGPPTTTMQTPATHAPSNTPQTGTPNIGATMVRPEGWSFSAVRTGQKRSEIKSLNGGGTVTSLTECGELNSIANAFSSVVARISCPRRCRQSQVWYVDRSGNGEAPLRHAYLSKHGGQSLASKS
jgi:hypothetical protein